MNRASLISSTKFHASELDLSAGILHAIGRFKGSDIIALCLPEEPNEALIIQCSGKVCSRIASKRKKVGPIDESDLERLIVALND